MADKPTEVEFNKGSKLAEVTAKGKREIPEWREYMEVFAEQRKIAYDSYLAQGFTPEQALQLCKSI